MEVGLAIKMLKYSFKDVN